MEWWRREEFAEPTAALRSMGFEPRAGVGVYIRELEDGSARMWWRVRTTPRSIAGDWMLTIRRRGTDGPTVYSLEAHAHDYEPLLNLIDTHLMRVP